MKTGKWCGGFPQLCGINVCTLCFPGAFSLQSLGHPGGLPSPFGFGNYIACTPDEFEEQTSIISPALTGGMLTFLSLLLPLSSSLLFFFLWIPVLLPAVTTQPTMWLSPSTFLVRCPSMLATTQLKAHTFWLRKWRARQKSCSVVLWIFSVVTPDRSSAAQMAGKE